VLNRRRYISTLPTLERKLRVFIDWTLDFIFNNDTAGLLDYDYRVQTKQTLRAVTDSEMRPVSTSSFLSNSEHGKPGDRKAA